MFQAVHIGVESGQIETVFCVPTLELRATAFHKREEHIKSKSAASPVNSERLVVK